MHGILRSRILLIVLLLAVVGSLAILFAVGKPKRDAVRIVTPPAIIASLPHWIAEKEGFYKDEGLDVRTITQTNSQYMAQAITSNDADILPAVSLVDVINNQSQALDRPLIYSHSRMRSDPAFESILVISSSTIKSPKDLEGRRIAVYPGATATECVRLYLKNSGVDTTKITFKPLPPPEHVPALQRGDVDASHLYDPNRTQALQGNLCREVIRGIYPSLNEPSAIGCSAVSARFVQENAAALQKYLRAWDRAIRFIRTNPDEARQVLAEKLNLSPDVAKNATWVDATTSDELDPKAIRSTIETIQRLGLITKDFDPAAASCLLKQP